MAGAKTLAITIFMGSQPVYAASELCNVIRQFETAPHTQSTGPQKRRSIEVRWGVDPTAMFSIGCNHSNEEVIGKQTCVWLLNHTSQEFSMDLPMSIMACYGYRFPKGSLTQWHGISGSIDLLSKSDADAELILDLDFGPNNSAIRLSVEEFGVKYGPTERPKL